MVDILGITLSIFGNYYIKPTSKTMVSIMESLNAVGSLEFLPNVVNAQIINPETGQITDVSNMSFTTPNRSYQVLYMNDRVNVIIMTTKDSSVTSERVEAGSKIMEAIMKHDSIRGNRLAFNIDIVYRGSKLVNLMDNNIIGFYENKFIRELSTRVNAQFKLEKLNEPINVITTTTNAQESLQSECITHYHIDINTIAENQTCRFSYNDFSSFLLEADNISKKIMKDLTGCDNYVI